MTVSTVISKTDLARHARQVVDQARRGRPVIIESYGEEQVAVLDAADYRCLRALAAYYALPPHPAPVSDPSLAPRGLDQSDVKAAIAAAEGDPQAAWNRILAAYLDGDISLGRAAQLLGVDRFELTARLGRLELPLRLGSATQAEAWQELTRLDT
jgi:prevent-host-death family protein